MAQQYEHLDIAERSKTKGRTSRRLRREGLIPANYYYKGEDNLNLTVKKNNFLKSMRAGHRIFEVDLKGGNQYVMVKDIQYHPVTDDIIHIDLMRVRRDEKMTISVQLVLEGTPAGVKEGGVMMQNLTAIDISCLPGDVPEHVTIDVSELELHANLNVEDIEVPEKLEIITGGDTTVVSCQLPKEEVEEEVPEEDIDTEEGEEPEEGEGESTEEASE